MFRLSADNAAINRLGFDNLQRLDPARDFQTAFQASLGTAANPHGLVGFDGELFVSRYEPPFDDVARVAVLTTAGLDFEASFFSTRILAVDAALILSAS